MEGYLHTYWSQQPPIASSMAICYISPTYARPPLEKYGLALPLAY